MKQWRSVALGLAWSLTILGSFAQENESAPKGDISRGQDVFEGQCYDCHNADSDIVKTGPGFKGVSKGKLPSGAEATRENVLAIVNEGVGEDMPPYAGVLSEQEKEDVIAYVLSR